jgi:hypothetical protein
MFLIVRYRHAGDVQRTGGLEAVRGAGNLLPYNKCAVHILPQRHAGRQLVPVAAAQKRREDVL